MSKIVECNRPECPCHEAAKGLIDFDKPVELTSHPAQVRVLSKSVRSPDGSSKALVAITQPDYDELAYVDEYGCGVTAAKGWVCSIRNIGERYEETLFINLYSHGTPNTSVIGSFDTKEQADANSINGTRDCCIKLSAVKTNGNWTASATVV
jgi:hypothetical protein